MNIRKFFITLTPVLSSRTAKNTAFIFTGNSLGLIFAFVFTYILVRILSLEDVGYFSTVFAFLLLSTDIADIGIGTSLSRFLPPLKSEPSMQTGFLKTAFLLQIGIALTFACLVYLLSGFLAGTILHSRTYDYLFRIVSFGIFGSIISNFFYQALAAKENFVWASVSSLGTGLIRVVMAGLLMFLGTVSLSGMVWIQSLGYIVIGLIFLFVINPAFLLSRSLRKDLFSLISFAKYVGIAKMLTALSSRLDILMFMALTNNAYDAGVYGIASRMAVMYPLFSGSFSTVLAPRLSSSKSKKEVASYLKKAILVTLALIATIIILIIFAYPFLSLLFQDKGRAAAPIYRIYLVAMIFFVGSIPSVALVTYYLKKPWILSVNSIIQLVTVFFGNLIMIPAFGIYGTVYSLILAYSITLFLTSYLSYRYFMLHHD